MRSISWFTAIYLSPVRSSEVLSLRDRSPNLSWYCTTTKHRLIPLRLGVTAAVAGFSHSAFTFAHESLVARTVVADAEVPPGALVAFLQKGLQYVEVETHLQEVRGSSPATEHDHLDAVCARRGSVRNCPIRPVPLRFCRTEQKGRVTSRSTCWLRISAE
jgi:hypothetical protein